MIRLQNLTKTFVLQGQRKTILDDVTLTFPTGVSVALLGRNGSGKSTLMELIAGTAEPTMGHIHIKGSVSWPVGFAGSFHPELSGAQNIRFIARIYGVDADELVDFVEEFAEIGKHYRLPVRTYSSGMRSRLAFGSSMGIAFDTYLMDEVGAVGDAAFKAKSAALLRDRMQRSGAILVTHSAKQVRELCQAGAVLEDGKLIYYEDVDEALAHHDRNMQS